MYPYPIFLSAMCCGAYLIWYINDFSNISSYGFYAWFGCS